MWLLSIKENDMRADRRTTNKRRSHGLQAQMATAPQPPRLPNPDATRWQVDDSLHVPAAGRNFSPSATRWQVTTHHVPAVEEVLRVLGDRVSLRFAEEEESLLVSRAAEQ
jgi:hypothetical protein